MLSEPQWQKLSHLFSLLDANDSGAVEFDDIELVMSKILVANGHDPASIIFDGAEAMIRRFWTGLKRVADSNRDDRISRAEWLACWERLLEHDNIHAPLQQLPPTIQQIHTLLALALGINDRNGADFTRWARFANALGIQQPSQTFKELDIDQNGIISSDELRTLIAEFFLSDQEVPGNRLFG